MAKRGVRGEICVGAASILSLAALVLLIFMHVGSINTSSVPRGTAMVKINVSQYGNGLYAALGDPIQGLYTSNASAPLGQGQGLRQLYEFGLYSYCGLVSPKEGTCSNHTAARRFEPYTVLINDMLDNYTLITDGLFDTIPSTSFRNSGSLGSSSKSGYYLLLIGTITTALALLSGVCKHTVAFLLSSLLSIVSSILLLAGAAVWTALVTKAQNVNKLDVGSGSSEAPLGIVVSQGNGLFLAWAAFACMFVSILPYMTSSCTYRG